MFENIIHILLVMIPVTMIGLLLVLIAMHGDFRESGSRHK